MNGIKETLELLDSLEIIAVAGAKIAKDGKLSPSDLTIVYDLLLKSPKIAEGFKGINKLSAEIKDLDAEEIESIISKTFVIINSVKEVLK
jgi:hypothetical protein